MEQSTLIQRKNGDIVDLVETLRKGDFVVVDKIPQGYTLAPRSDLVRMLDGSVVSFMETLVTFFE